MKLKPLLGMLALGMSFALAGADETTTVKELPLMKEPIYRSGWGTTTVKAPLTKISMFKNGLASVERTFKISRGEMLIDETIEPVHGTLWFTPEMRVRSVGKKFTVPKESLFENLSETYRDKKVKLTVLSSDGKEIIYEGVVVNPSPRAQDKKQWSRDYSSGYDRYGYRIYQPPVANIQPSSRHDPYLLIRTESGALLSILTGRIIMIESEGMNMTREVERKVLLAESSELSGTATISYLTKGITWAPSYRIQLLSDTKMKLEMAAVLINELDDFTNAEVSLISGYPNVEYSRTVSPMAGNVSLSSFFMSLASPAGGAAAGAAVTQQMVMFNTIDPNNYSSGNSDAGIPESADSEDLSYRSIGRISMQAGETLLIPVESVETSYDKIVEWQIKDRRNQWGYYDYWNYYQNRDKNVNLHGDLWAAVRFRNPFKTPMTTAPAEITESGKFLGQTTSYWINPGQENILRITKALSVTGVFNEYEVDMKRPIVEYGGRNFRNPNVNAEAVLKNYRSEAVKVLVKVQFSGELISADEPPEKRLLESGVYCINPRSELIWELTLQPKEEKSLKFTYSVLVYH